MVSASILVDCRNMSLWLGAALAVLLTACSSPLDLDVDRTTMFNDDIVHPSRISLLYYFGDSAYEAIYVDPAFLQSIDIDTSTNPVLLTIPQFNTPLFPSTATETFTPMVRAFGFSVTKFPCNERIMDVINRSTFFSVEVLHQDGRRQDYQWQADDSGRRFRLGLVASRENRLLKGRIAMNIADPERPRVLSYYGILTIEY